MPLIAKENIYNYKKSDTIVIYGSGYSLKELDVEQWDELKTFDSMGFNWFVFQEWFKPTYVVVGDIRPDKKNKRMGKNLQDTYIKYFEEVARNGRYANSVFFASVEQLEGIPSDFEKYKYHSLTRITDWELIDLSTIYWSQSSTFACLNIAMKLGYKKVIFAGIDLYDYRFFYLDRDQLRIVGNLKANPSWADRKLEKKHPIFKKIVPWFENHKKMLMQEGMSLYSYNPKSLLLRSPMIKEWE